jgi:hypothetical protein
LVSYISFKKFLWRALLVCAALVLLSYLSDTLLFKYQAAHSQPGSPFDTVTVYMATPMKNGQVQLFYQHPQSLSCVRTIFPHSGYEPCWYLSQSSVKMI